VSSPFTRTHTRSPAIFGAYARTPARAFVEDEGVGRQPDRLLQKFLAIGRDVEKAARKRHGIDPSARGVSGGQNRLP
jgi:hypothetical protein